jgi:hypothetical protein
MHLRDNLLADLFKEYSLDGSAHRSSDLLIIATEAIPPATVPRAAPVIEVEHAGRSGPPVAKQWDDVRAQKK